MDISLLTEISNWLSAAILLLSSIFLMLLAPDLALGWIKKLLWLSIILAVWMVFVQPYLNDLKAFFICIFTYSGYMFVTSDTMVFLNQCLLFLVTFKLFSWLFDTKGPERNEELPRAPGFSTRKLK